MVNKRILLHYYLKKVFNRHLKKQKNQKESNENGTSSRALENFRIR